MYVSYPQSADFNDLAFEYLKKVFHKTLDISFNWK